MKVLKVQLHPSIQGMCRGNRHMPEARIVAAILHVHDRLSCSLADMLGNLIHVSQVFLIDIFCGKMRKIRESQLRVDLDGDWQILPRFNSILVDRWRVATAIQLCDC